MRDLLCLVGAIALAAVVVRTCDPRLTEDNSPFCDPGCGSWVNGVWTCSFPCRRR